MRVVNFPWIILLVFFLLGTPVAFGRSDPETKLSGTPTLRPHGSGMQLFVDGQPYLILSAETDNSSGSSLEFMHGSFDKLNTIHANTATVALSWELVEPQEGHFDLHLIDGLIGDARRHHLHLIFLWFGTWKNTFSSYTPAWVKTDRTRFLFAQPTPGDMHWGAISAWSDAAMKADAHAFAAVMHRIRQVDSTQHTVLMMQVENETGLIGGSRDHVPPAETDFAAPVPSTLLTYLEAHHTTLIPELRQAWEAAGARTNGTWGEVFGTVADEAFMAWHYGRYVDAIAAAGKQEYPIPMFANAWLEGTPGSYPNGGPVSRMMDIWRAAAPHLDLFAPDIYRDAIGFRQISILYTRSHNPLMVVESSADAAPACAFTALAGFGAIGFGSYALEQPFDTASLGTVYQCLANMMPLLTRFQGTDAMADVLVNPDETEVFQMGGYQITVKGIALKSAANADAKPATPHPLPGYGMILALGPGDFVIVGIGFSVDIGARPGNSGHVERLSVDEGQFAPGGIWVPGRRLNGDEYEGALKLDGMQPGYAGIPEDLQVRRLEVGIDR